MGLKGREEGWTCRSQAVCGFLSITYPCYNPPRVAELVVSYPPLQNLCLQDSLSDPTQKGSHVLTHDRRQKRSHQGERSSGEGVAKWGLWQPRGVSVNHHLCWGVLPSNGFLETSLLPVSLKAKYSPVLSPFLLDYLQFFLYLWPLWWHCCSVTQLCPTLCDPMDCSTSGFPVLHHLPEFT